jgi:hypothetical protein
LTPQAEKHSNKSKNSLETGHRDSRRRIRPCLVACSVLKDEIEKLAKNGELDADLLFVSKYFHVDYAQIEKHLRPVIERALKSHPQNVVLVYGDLCLGMDNEMKKLTEEYGITKIDALNCVDCQLGGKGIYQEADPHHDLMFLSPGMIDFFIHAQRLMRKEGLAEVALKQLFSGLRGIVILDTLGTLSELKSKVEKLDTGLVILEAKAVGCENVRNVIQEAIERSESLQSG